jgi:molecular chaperone DnaK (HSP70)
VKDIGLKVKLINEPTAVALAYSNGLGSNVKSKRFAVFDFGAGKFDVSVF